MSVRRVVKDAEANAYAEASAGIGAARRVKAQVYGTGKPVGVISERTASSAALLEQNAAEATQVRIPAIVTANSGLS